MWKIALVNSSRAAIRFTDGIPGLDAERGGTNTSTRLVVDGQGFIDITDCSIQVASASITFLDVNGVRFSYLPTSKPVVLHLTITPLSFSAGVENVFMKYRAHLKPLPSVSDEDAAFIDQMIMDKYVPYQENFPGDPGKSEEELRELGKKLFPFTPYTFQLAISVYDWTTPSFVRMALMKIYEYSRVQAQPAPLSLPDIANAIWSSSWNGITTRDPVYMNSFMMKPTITFGNLFEQLSNVHTNLQSLSAVENRLLSSAVVSLPRTCVLNTPRLFSGQVDIEQLGMDTFGIQFLESPLNEGPVGTPLRIPFATAMASAYMQPGRSITSKMVYSFTDSLEGAMHYSNGIILVVDPPKDSIVWEDMAYISPLSVNPEKTEYIFAPGTTFVIQSVESSTVTVGGIDKGIQIINLALHESSSPRDRCDHASSKSPIALEDYGTQPHDGDNEKGKNICSSKPDSFPPSRARRLSFSFTPFARRLVDYLWGFL